MPPVVDPSQHDQFVLRQRIKLVINQYEFSLAEGEPPFCFVEQKGFKFKEDIRFFADDSKSVELLRIKARQRFDPRATYDITGPGGEKIGEVQKVFGNSLLRSTFAIRDGQVLGEHRRRIGKFRDIYDIDFSQDSGRTLDRRMVLAAAVGMDALQAR